MEEHIKNRVHELYWNDDINCARMAIICLSELFETAVEPQTIWSAVGMHGVGGYRALHRPPYYGLPPYGDFALSMQML